MYHSKLAQNLSTFHRSLNLSEFILSIQLWHKNDSGKLQKLILTPTDGNMEDRDIDCQKKIP